MKAVRMHRPGGPEVLELESVPEPQIRPDEVLVRVRATSLNHLDIWARTGSRPVDLPRILGNDIAGEVATVGPLAAGVAVGDRVLLACQVTCMRCPACLSGRHNYCPQAGTFGVARDGGNAEYVAAPAVNCLPVPDGLDFVQAAAVPMVFTTAWHMAVTRARVSQQDSVLVWAASSGVGSAAVQICKLFGARVIATAGTDAKCEKAKALGADAVVNHSSGDVLAAVKSFTDGRGVDVVVDNVGQATWERSVRALAVGGRYITVGVTTGREVTLDLNAMYARQQTIMGSTQGSKGEMLTYLPHFTAGRLRPVIDRTYPLEAAAEAHRAMEARDFFGKLVLTV